MQERVGLDLDPDAIAIADNPDLMYVAHRRARLTRDRAERTEIMLSDQRLCCAAHRVLIQRQTFPGDVTGIERGSRRPIDDHVTIAARQGPITRMECIAD